eukprot:657975-Pleurochrysis_carterae.AAC.4
MEQCSLCRRKIKRPQYILLKPFSIDYAQRSADISAIARHARQAVFICAKPTPPRAATGYIIFVCDEIVIGIYDETVKEPCRVLLSYTYARTGDEALPILMMADIRTIMFTARAFPVANNNVIAASATAFHTNCIRCIPRCTVTAVFVRRARRARRADAVWTAWTPTRNNAKRTQVLIRPNV